MLFNLALLLYQSQQYGKALRYLTPIHRKIENTEELLAVKSMLLWVQVNLALGRLSDAKEGIGWLDAQLTKSSAILQDGEEAKVPVDPVAQKSVFLGGSPEESQKNARCINAKELRLALCLLRAQLCLSVPVTYKAVAELLAEARSLKDEIDLSHFPAHMEGWLRSHYETCVGLLSAQLEYLSNNPTAALRIVTQTEQIAQSSLGSRACHPACQPAPGAKLAYPVYYYNNLGCIHLRLKKPKLALLYFSKAYETISAQSSVEEDAVARPTDAVTFYASQRRGEVLFNMGLALLASNLPGQALDCFLECGGLMKGNARYWYRLAQCYVMQHLQTLQDAQLTHQSDLYVSQLNGVYRLPAKAVYNFDEEEERKGGKADLIEQALKSLRNALVLLPSEDEDLKVHVLLLLAYTCIGREPQSALKYLHQLSACDLSPQLKATVALYTAEANAQIGKLKVALEQLTNLSLPRETRLNCHSTLCPRAVSLYEDLNWRFVQAVNSASILISSGNLAQAQVQLAAAASTLPSSQPLPGPLLHLHVYLALKAGNHKQAAEILQTRQLPSK